MINAGVYRCCRLQVATHHDHLPAQGLVDMGYTHAGLAGHQRLCLWPDLSPHPFTQGDIGSQETCNKSKAAGEGVVKVTMVIGGENDQAGVLLQALK